MRTSFAAVKSVANTAYGQSLVPRADSVVSPVLVCTQVGGTRVAKLLSKLSTEKLSNAKKEKAEN